MGGARSSSAQVGPREEEKRGIRISLLITGQEVIVAPAQMLSCSVRNALEGGDFVVRPCNSEDRDVGQKKDCIWTRHSTSALHNPVMTCLEVSIQLYRMSVLSLQTMTVSVPSPLCRLWCTSVRVSR